MADKKIEPTNPATDKTAEAADGKAVDRKTSAARPGRRVSGRKTSAIRPRG